MIRLEFNKKLYTRKSDFINIKVAIHTFCVFIMLSFKDFVLNRFIIECARRNLAKISTEYFCEI